MLFGAPVDAMLDALEKDGGTEEVTLETFLDEGELIGELRALNKRLLEYLSTDESLRGLVSYATAHVPASLGAQESEVDKRRKYSLVSTEILSSQIPEISNRFVVADDLLEKLFLVFEGELELFVASNVCRVIVALLREHNIPMLMFIRGRKSFVSTLLGHMSLVPAADLIVRLLDGPENDNVIQPPRREATDLLAREDVLNRLVDVFVETVDSKSGDEQAKTLLLSTISEVILACALRTIELGKVFIPIPGIINPYNNSKSIARMVTAGLKDLKLSNGKRNDALIFSLNVVIEMLSTETNKIALQSEKPAGKTGKALTSVANMSQMRSNLWSESRTQETTDESAPKQFKPVVSTANLEKELSVCFEELRAVLKQRALQKAVLNAACVVHEPLGSTRLKVVEFFTTCMKQGKEMTILALDDVELAECLLDLFFQYEWNNMLHHLVTSAVVHALESDEEAAQAAWLKGDIIGRIISKWNEETQNTDGHQQNAGGHLGHLIVLASAVKEFLEKSGDRRQVFFNPDELKAFDAFCSQELSPAMDIQRQKLGGGVPNDSAGSECSDVVEEDTDVVEIDTLFNKLAKDRAKVAESDEDSDEDDDEIEIVDTTIPAEEMSRVLRMGRRSHSSKSPSTPQPQPEDSEWVVFEPEVGVGRSGKEAKGTASNQPLSA
eukprot:CAMPEP_0184743348 /NCGR_PEP_ID=MMETSP0315-20130426/6230_1 /TAXON_ID=101924 /ORGANISM="Rhodosorus marinus, Strain UTEX LB 2760" /LENGTH=667 /DNA_ID=CAMNT_0027214575 /DNA_START=25 /DNA_END=2028 /DNA_ORIENTATION=+